MAQKPKLAKGTRDFPPIEVAKRNYITKTIKKYFKLYGFQPIETPSFENSTTLLGKYGDEGDRLIFKILDSADFTVDLKRTISRLEVPDVLIDKIFDRLVKDTQKLAIDPQKALQNEDYLEAKKQEVFRQMDLKELMDDEFIEHNKNHLKFLDDLGLTQSIAYSIIGYLIELVIYDAIDYSKSKLLVERIVKKEIETQVFQVLKNAKSSSLISKKALRYDLTVPFARYVVQHQNELEFPFKRYQIQPVWRADRPQKGRFREFYQCDADVIGSESLWQEVEFIRLYDAVFTALNLDGVTLKVNNRKILSGLAEMIGESDKLIAFTVALDKLDKIGEDGVKKEMLGAGIPSDTLSKLDAVFRMEGSFAEKLEQLTELLADSEVGLKGVEELEFIRKALAELPLKTSKLDLDVTLARGLEYYTGAIIEVAAPDSVKMGSIGGGGRYDDLTGIFGLDNMSGMGISFGLDRIYLVLEELGLFPQTVLEGTKVLFVNFGDREAVYALQAIERLRDAGVSAELYPDNAKMKKQFNHADKRDIPYVVLVGSKEIEAGEYTLKNMKSGDQKTVSFKQLLETIVA